MDVNAPFQFQLEMLKQEYETINSSIRQMDDISKSLKEWAITLWTAAVGGALITPDLNNYIVVTAAVPLLFWLVDSYHHVVQRRFIWRSLRIMDFMNSENLFESFERKKLVGLTVLDAASRRERDGEIIEFTSWPRVMFFRTMSILYIGLALLSVAIWLTV
ncbi:hypothetical protein N9383_03895 [Granulosicoccus sp.]|nr:hypothetical protein [Granulosicoccus sp.]